MYEILISGNGYLIRDIDQPENAIQISDMVAMLQLRKRIHTLVDTLETDGEVHGYTLSGKAQTITNAEARRIAADAGYDLPKNTLLAACHAGNIVGAEKVGGRWTVPRPAFEEWFELWKLKASRD